METTMNDLASVLDEKIAGSNKRPTAIVIDSRDPRIIEAVSYLVRYIRPVFLASEEEIRDVIGEKLAHADPTRLDFAMQESAFVDLDNNELIDEFARAFRDLPEETHGTKNLDSARETISNPVFFGIMAVREGHADMVIGGIGNYKKRLLEPAAAILGEATVSKSVLFSMPEQFSKNAFQKGLIIFGDVALNRYTNADILGRIAAQTCITLRDIIPEDVLPEIRAGIVLPSYNSPLDDIAKQASASAEDIISSLSKEDSRFSSIKIAGEVRSNEILRRCHDHISKFNALICPNAEIGDVIVNFYSGHFPEASRIELLSGIKSKCVDLSINCKTEDIVLSVKAALARFPEEWVCTPKDTFFKDYRILVVNPGSTSTKIAVFEGDREIFAEELKHSAEELEPFNGKNITEQGEFRKGIVLRALENLDLTVDDLDAISARGGLVKPIPHGTYIVDEELCNDLRIGVNGQHASNLGGLIAAELVGDSGKPAFIIDPVVVDEVPTRAKITGIKEIRRKVISHALNQIATAKRYAEENGTFYEYLNLIVAHMGGGITIGAHKKGRYIDVNNGLNGEGPFTPERSGSIPTGQLIELCFSGKYSHKELKQLNKGKGGLIDLLGTSNFRKITNRVIDGDPEAAEVFEALTYQIAKNITTLLPAFDGESVDRVLLTGGMARSNLLCGGITKAVAALGCGVSVYPGENEMDALAIGALRVLRGKEEARKYAPED